MSSDVEAQLRSPEAYASAASAIALMERDKVWPTPLNYELWLHLVCEPDGPLAREIERLLEIGEAITEAVSEELAAIYLPKVRLNDQIRDAGDQLSRELAEATEPPVIKKLVDSLSTATRKIQRENKSLEKRLAESTAEVTRLKDHLEQVRRDATTDALTNLANRKAFDDELERACLQADESGEPLTLAVIDIDHFKNFNDTWGHQTGDQVIRYVSSVIGRMAPPPRFAARYGGEEFAMIFPGERVADALAVLEEIREEVSSRRLKRRSTNDDLGAVTVSSGVAQRKPGELLHNLVDRADTALYASKRAGRNRVTNAETSVANAA